MSLRQQTLPPPPPPPIGYPPMDGSHDGGASFGPVIGVLTVVVFLTVIAYVVGRLCRGRRILAWTGR
ncbi:hypothetical protein HPP92_001135 [Vanilla planifolia]|uniref:Uncharacterized protein n=1 Tax=Vanilla planifolia TaxID=51239 RepID=A0A835VHF2_VANPL|nr:hypothetical protein HPP92_001292 [Vanilla planifolia]KAG0501063.1 hypothetical protein HPP92_001135 [Vanilla planifolia]